MYHFQLLLLIAWPFFNLIPIRQKWNKSDDTFHTFSRYEKKLKKKNLKTEHARLGNKTQKLNLKITVPVILFPWTRKEEKEEQIRKYSPMQCFVRPRRRKKKKKKSFWHGSSIFSELSPRPKLSGWQQFNRNVLLRGCAWPATRSATSKKEKPVVGLPAFEFSFKDFASF